MSFEDTTFYHKISENKHDCMMIGEMTKRAVRDYFYSFRPKKIFTFDISYVVFFFYLMPVFYTFLAADETKDILIMRIWMIACGLIPMIIAFVGIQINVFSFPKILYLCPMNAQQRKEYTVAMFWIRMVFPGVLFVAGRLILWILAPVSIFYLVIDFIYILAICGMGMMKSSTNVYWFNSQVIETASYGDAPLMVETMFNQRWAKKTPINEMANNGVFSMFIGYFTWFFAVRCGAYELSDNIMTRILCAAVIFILGIQVYLTYKMYTKLDDYIQYISSYEGA